MNHFLVNGRAPHSTEIARRLDVAPDEGPWALHELSDSGISGWLFPETDYVV